MYSPAICCEPLARCPNFARSLRLHLVETSPLLRAVQQRRLAFAQPVWLGRVEELPVGPILIVANEFLDALPIRQLVRGQVDIGRSGWWRWIAKPVGPSRRSREPRFSPWSRPRYCAIPAHPGAVFEFCPSAVALGPPSVPVSSAIRAPRCSSITAISRAGSGSSLRALSRHQPVDPLIVAGQRRSQRPCGFCRAFADAARAAGSDVYGPMPQGRFLALLGAAERLAALSQQATSAQRPQLETGVERLLDPAQMGDLFKALALVSPSLPTPFGFDFAETRQ